MFHRRTSRHRLSKLLFTERQLLGAPVRIHGSLLLMLLGHRAHRTRIGRRRPLTRGFTTFNGKPSNWLSLPYNQTRMKITSAEFVKSAFARKDWPNDGRPEIAFLGRSNVGKSSLLNSLLQRRSLARTSNTPGRTQSINYFLINDRFYFVDLPGYGFAKVSKAMRAGWGAMAEDYLSQRDELALCIQLIDARHDPTNLDLQLNEWLLFHGRKHLVVATKSDKLSANELNKQLRKIEKDVARSTVLPYSSQTGKGRDAVWAAIEGAMEERNVIR